MEVQEMKDKLLGICARNLFDMAAANLPHTVFPDRDKAAIEAYRCDAVFNARVRKLTYEIIDALKA